MSGPDTLRFTLLGSGSSPGVPRPNGDWGTCDPANPKNRRRRAAALVERIKPTGDRTTVVIDTGPDFREQMIMADVRHIDAVVYTHPHADHIHGLDDLRSYVLKRGDLLDIYADSFTQVRLMDGFGYCFATPPGSSYPPILRANLIEHAKPVTITGAGGSLTFQPLPQIHGDILSLGFRIGNIAYCSDVSDWPQETVNQLLDLDLLVIDALQYQPHPSHFSLAQALDWVERLKPRQTWLTHMHTPLDYDEVNAKTPDNVQAGYDGLEYETAIG